jgi:enoyl-CoA hydratase
MPNKPVKYELRDRVACVSIDDGKANALSHEVIEALQESRRRAESEASALVLSGREGRFSGGFDLKTMGAGGDAVRGLVGAGAQLLLDLYGSPLPVVSACTGHAVAAGALVLLASDLRVGVQGDYKIGLTEVGIGMTLPVFATELARDRLSKRHFDRATCHAQLYSADAAVDAGFLDETVPGAAHQQRAFEEAARLGALSRTAFAASKARAHGATIALIRASLEADLESLTSPTN